MTSHPADADCEEPPDTIPDFLPWDADPESSDAAPDTERH